MTDGTSGVAVATIAGALGAMGLDPAFLVVALIGAAAYQAWSSVTVSRRRAIAQVIAGGVFGAFGAVGLADWQGIESKATISLMAAVIGWGYHIVLSDGFARVGVAMSSFLDRIGGKP